MVLLHSELQCVGSKYRFSSVKILRQVGLNEKFSSKCGKHLTAEAAASLLQLWLWWAAGDHRHFGAGDKPCQSITSNLLCTGTCHFPKGSVTDRATPVVFLLHKCHQRTVCSGAFLPVPPAGPGSREHQETAKDRWPHTSCVKPELAAPGTPGRWHYCLSGT